MAIYQEYTKDAAQVVADANTSVTDKIVAFVGAPFSTDENTLVSKKTQSVNVLGWAAISLLGGELLGHYRARDGKQALVPFGRP